MKTTYKIRRNYILNEATAVSSTLSKYPALSFPAVVSCPSYLIQAVTCFFLQIHQEIGLIVGDSEVKANFLEKWSTKFAPAILSYGEKCRISVN